MIRRPPIHIGMQVVVVLLSIGVGLSIMGIGGKMTSRAENPPTGTSTAECQ